MVGRFAIIIALAGCNQVYGLEGTVLFDGLGAPGPDAPFACPDLGTAPKFSGTLQLWTNRNCESYSTSTTGTAILDCRDSLSIETGPVDGPFAPAVGLPKDGGGQYFARPRISPEGDEVFVLRSDFSGDPDNRQIWLFGATTNGWQRGADFPLRGQYNLEVSNPTRAPDRRVIVSDDSNDNMIEYANTGAGWASTGETYAKSHFANITQFAGASLSPDGLRLVFAAPKLGGTYVIWYSDRGSLGERFRPASELVGVPSGAIFDPFMTEDCGRLYFSQTSMYYVQQMP